MTQTAYIALGSNLGDREGTLRRAIDMMRGRRGLAVEAVSAFIENEPEGSPAGQGAYLNAVAKVSTTLRPEELLGALQEIEQALGRNRAAEGFRGARTCDLDILLIGDLVVDSPTLTVPHPRMHTRRFVLAPLAEIAPLARHPRLNKTAVELLADLEAQP
ncbi:MAG: 2-amino-4-hydroxy-6-hydroxymethyldihydropteridine diphosphokinase [Phycisphaerae bacterium]|jgi:2-amino-4-hydroxy-6-hydroxymethyldihydropteridine diphosphokinase